MAKLLCRFADIGKLWPSRELLTSQINAICENEIETKISEFAVTKLL